MHRRTLGRARRLVQAAAIVVSLLALGTSAAASPACVDYAEFVQWAGVIGWEYGPIASVIAMAGHVAYVAVGPAPEPGGTPFRPGLGIADLTDPRNPQTIGHIDLPNYATGFAIAGSYLYVTDSDLRIYDITNPGSPTPAGFVDIAGTATRVCVVGNRAYVAAGSAGLVIVDVTQASAPQIIGSLDTAGDATDVAVAGDHAYVADTSALCVIDVSDPALPWLTGSVTESARRVEVADHLVFAGSWNGLKIIDVANPAAPQRIGVVAGHSVEDLVLADDRVYLASTNAPQFQVVDAANPEAPLVAASCILSGNGSSLAVAGGYAIVACGGGSVQIVDIGNGRNIPALGQVSFPVASRVRVGGDYAYVLSTGTPKKIRVVDIATPETPVVMGSLEITNWTGRLALSGTRVLVADGSYDVMVIDVSNPASPRVERTIPMPDGSSAFDSAVAGNYLYVAADVGGLKVFNMATATLVGSVATPYGVHHVVLDGTFAYVVGSGSGFLIYDLTDPTRPWLVSETPLWSISDMFVSGGLAYFCGTFGFRVYDVSNPHHPALTGSVWTPGRTGEIEVLGDYAFVSGQGLQVFDVSDPTAPSLVGSAANITSTGIALHNGRICLPAWSSGLLVMPAQCVAAAPVVDLQPRATMRLAALPNPAPGRTWLRIDGGPEGSAAVQIFDLAGRRIRALTAEVSASGAGGLVWDGCDAEGRAVPAGVYLARVVVAGQTSMARVMIMR